MFNDRSSVFQAVNRQPPAVKSGKIRIASSGLQHSCSSRIHRSFRTSFFFHHKCRQSCLLMGIKPPRGPQIACSGRVAVWWRPHVYRGPHTGPGPNTAIQLEFPALSFNQWCYRVLFDATDTLPSLQIIISQIMNSSPAESAVIPWIVSTIFNFLATFVESLVLFHVRVSLDYTTFCNCTLLSWSERILSTHINTY